MKSKKTIEAAPERVTNREFAKSDANFLYSCNNVGLEPTRRQASKFRRKLGKAYGLSRGLSAAA